jgi:arylformamidase
VPIVDISLPVTDGMLTWPGDPTVAVTPVSRLEWGNAANVSALALGTHTGTHIDPPRHFDSGGPAVDELSLDVLVGAAFVADAAGRPGPLGPAELEALAIPEGTERLLLRTDNSRLWSPLPARLPDHWVGVSGDGAGWIRDRGFRLIGIDFLSVDDPGAIGYPAHLILLSAGIVILEGLDLSEVGAGAYTLLALPLRVAGGDGAPARAVLLSD